MIYVFSHWYQYPMIKDLLLETGLFPSKRVIVLKFLALGSGLRLGKTITEPFFVVK